MIQIILLNQQQPYNNKRINKYFNKKRQNKNKTRLILYLGDKMKKKLIKVLFPCFLSVICGSICGKLVYGIYNQKLDEDLSGQKIYLIQSGAYSSYDNMINQTLLSNYVYYEDDDGLYKSIIGITEDKNNIDKIKNTYKNNTIITEYYSKDKELNKKINEYDKLLAKATTEEEIKKIIDETLKLYKDKNTTLTEIQS